ncbi:MAG TPA: TIGR01459 family HAD-type hydrolase [Acidimicrobiia bacterium]|nr:TIGR01459 family HAD-type hydrolase [Acidimicrobiia bacterium]
MRTKWLPGLSAVEADYDAYVIDQWGVLHDGRCSYPEVLGTLQELKHSDKRVVILTNSRKPLEPNASRLDALGITDALYDALVSSAAVLRDHLVSEHSLGKLGRKYFIVAKQEDLGLLDGTRFERVASPEVADFVLLLSSADDSVVSDHIDWILQAMNKKLIAYTSSNEPLTINRFGVFDGLAQIIAKYENLGGVVFNAGKPSPIVYNALSSTLNGIPPERVLAIGDQFESDILGAQTMGFDSALVTTGVNADQFGDNGDPTAAVENAMRIANGRTPATWVLPELRWSLARDAHRLPVAPEVCR